MNEEKVTGIRPDTIQLTESWEVLFHPYVTCLARTGGIGNMMTEIGNALYFPDAPTWRDEVVMVGHYEKSIRFSLERGPELSSMAPSSREAFQDWAMETMQEMGYEGWSVVDRVVTVQASDG